MRLYENTLQIWFEPDRNTLDFLPVPEDMRISYFLTHERERSKFIKDLLRSLPDSEILTQEITMGNSYNINSNGKFEKEDWKYHMLSVLKYAKQKN